MMVTILGDGFLTVPFGAKQPIRNGLFVTIISSPVPRHPYLVTGQMSIWRPAERLLGKNSRRVTAY